MTFKSLGTTVEGNEAAMIVCHCHRVSDRQIRSTVREGAVSVAEIGRRCGAGTGCGGCRPEVSAILQAEEGEHGARRSLLPMLQTG